MERYEEIEQTITKRFRKEIWKMFVKGISEYEMIQDGFKYRMQNHCFAEDLKGYSKK